VLDLEFVDLCIALLDNKNEFYCRQEVIMPQYGIFLICVFVCASVACGGNWPQWRGPYFNGSTDEKNRMLTFDLLAGGRYINMDGDVDIRDYSCSTLTSLGIGDIIPSNEFAVSLTCLEAIAGL